MQLECISGRLWIFTQTEAFKQEFQLGSQFSGSVQGLREEFFRRLLVLGPFSKGERGKQDRETFLTARRVFGALVYMPVWYWQLDTQKTKYYSKSP